VRSSPRDEFGAAGCYLHEQGPELAYGGLVEILLESPPRSGGQHFDAVPGLEVIEPH